MDTWDEALAERLIRELIEKEPLLPTVIVEQIAPQLPHGCLVSKTLATREAIWSLISTNEIELMTDRRLRLRTT